MSDRKGCMAADATVCMYIDGADIARLADYAELTGLLIQDAAKTLFLHGLDAEKPA